MLQQGLVSSRVSCDATEKMVNAESHRLSSALLNALTSAGYISHDPITDDHLQLLVAAAGSLPDGLVRYLMTSDGLTHPKLPPILGSSDMLKPYPASSLLPLRGDGSGNYESVLIEPGPGFGAVVFWDHETTKAEYLIASSVPSYLELLLVTVPRAARWSADGRDQDDFVRAHDAGAAQLLDDPKFQALVGSAGPSFTLEREEAPALGEPLPPGAREGVNPLTKERVVLMPAPKYRRPPKRG